jgi:circadian clock protein KaiB
VVQNRASTDGQLALKLYVAGRAPHSLQALANLEAILEAYAEPGSYTLEVIDALEEPLRALEEGIFVTPALVRVSPNHLHLVGALSEREEVARLLGLAPAPVEEER